MCTKYLWVAALLGVFLVGEMGEAQAGKTSAKKVEKLSKAVTKLCRKHAKSGDVDGFNKAGCQAHVANTAQETQAHLRKLQGKRFRILHRGAIKRAKKNAAAAQHLASFGQPSSVQAEPVAEGK